MMRLDRGLAGVVSAGLLAATACVAPVERARSAERLAADGVIVGPELDDETDAPSSVVFPARSSPPSHHRRGGFLPFERRAGMSAYGPEGAVPGPPDLDFAPAPAADRVLIDLARRVGDDPALAGAVADIDVDDVGGTLVVRATVESEEARRSLLRHARAAARGRVVRDDVDLRDGTVATPEER